MNVTQINSQGIVRSEQPAQVTLETASPPRWALYAVAGVITLHLSLELAILVMLVQLVGG